MTPEETAVKGSHWLIFHGKRDGVNSELRGTRGSAVDGPGTARAARAAAPDGLTAVAPACAEAGRPSGRGGCWCNGSRTPRKGPGAYGMDLLTLPV